MEPSRVRRCHSRGRLKDRIERKWSECPCENDVGRLSSGIGARRKRINVSTKFVLEIMLLYSLIVLNTREYEWKRDVKNVFSFCRPDDDDERGVNEIRRALPGIRFEIRTRRMNGGELPTNHRDGRAIIVRDYTHKITYVLIYLVPSRISLIHHSSTNNRDDCLNCKALLGRRV